MKSEKHESERESDSNQVFRANPTSNFLKSQAEAVGTNEIPPPFAYQDTGWAWVILGAACLTNAICIGTSLSLGVYNVALLESFGESKSLTSTIMAVCTFLRGIAGFPASLMINAWGCRKTAFCAGLLSATGCLISFYGNGVRFLIASFGLIGIGCGMGYCAATVIVSQYFEKRRPFALGVLATGGSTGTFLFPTIFQGSIDAYTWRGSMFILAGVYLHLLISGALMRPIPGQESNHQSAKQRLKGMFDVKPLRKPPFWILLVVNFLFLAGASANFIHFPAYSVSAGTPDFQASTLVSIIGFSSVISRFLGGIIVSTGQIDIFIYTSAAIGLCGVSNIALPLMIKSFVTQWIFSAMFGIYYSPFIAFLAALSTEIVGISSLSSAFGYLMIAQGLASLTSAPLAGYIFDTTKSYAYTFYVTGTELLLASVLTMVLAGQHGHTMDRTDNKENDIEPEEVPNNNKIPKSEHGANCNGDQKAYTIA